MKVFLRILAAIGIFFGVMLLGVVLSAILYPSVKTPGWFIAVTLAAAVAAAVFFLIRGAKRPSSRDPAVSPSPAEDRAPGTADYTRPTEGYARVPAADNRPPVSGGSSKMSGLKIALYTLLAFFGLSLFAGGVVALSGAPSPAVSVIAAMGLALFIWSVVRMARRSSKAYIDRQQKGYLFAGRFICVSGLELPPETACTVAYYPDRITISAMNQNFSLRHDRIKDVSTKTVTEIQKQYVSSAGGAVAGGLVFGPLGALIGGRTKTKYDQRDTRFIIFTYADSADGQKLQYIVFRYSAFDSSVKKFLSAYKEQNQGFSIDVEL